jgi:dTMP kinase
MKKFLIILLCSISLTLLSNQTMQINRGYLFSVEGTEGCGKTTLIKNLQKLLTDLNLTVITTREPGATALGLKLRTLLMDRTEPISTLAEFLVFAADRAQHFEQLIIPHLAQHHIVISDRMADSSLVYQGYVKGLDQEIIKTINTIAMQNRTPDLVFYLKIDCETALSRVNKRNQTETQDAFEKEILQQKQQLVDGFDLLLNNRDNVVILDATLSTDEIAKQALQAIIRCLQN